MTLNFNMPEMFGNTTVETRQQNLVPCYTRPTFGSLSFSYDSNVEAITAGLQLDQMYKHLMVH